MKQMKHYLLLCLFWATTLTASAQQPGFWKLTNETEAGKNLFAGQPKPSDYKLFQLDEKAFLAKVRTAPSEKTIAAKQSGFVLSFPNEKGELQQYRVVDAPVMEPALAAKYPGIRSYAGVSVSDPSSIIRFSVSPQGMHGMILSSKKPTVYIEPLADNYYMVVSVRSLPASTEPFICNAEERVLQAPGTAQRNADDGKLRTYRLALCASGYFSVYWLNGTEQNDAERKAKVLTAQVNLITRLNGVYERDFGIRLLLVANNDAVIYLDDETDPFSEQDNWQSETQATCDNVIAPANYDIGHMVTRLDILNTLSGIARLNSVCTANKGSGWSGNRNPSDSRLGSTLMHEIGHQFGANHTFSHTYQNPISQCEPGSGSTIMSYAGLTGAATNVQPYRDDYFHAISIQQVCNFMKSVTGSCAVPISTGNTTPAAGAGADYIIPKSTPFVLTGTGSDADGNPLTYTWEQIDSRTPSSPPVPNAMAAEGPLFRSFPPGVNEARTFPAIDHILDGTNTTQWEVLPAVARTLNFRFTVRDNKPGGGSNQSDDMKITVDGNAGPFAVTQPNTFIIWPGNSSQTIKWDVRSTNTAPVNCANVKISLSTDGGASFATLVASTPNDGAELITIPYILTTTARIKVEAVGNIFFDISDNNFFISAPAPCNDPTVLSYSAFPTSATLSWNAVPGALTYDVDYKPASSAVWINAATATTALSVNLSGLTQVTLYNWRVRTACSAGNGNYTEAEFTTTAPCSIPGGLISSGITSSAATVSWDAAPGALSYDVDYKPASSATWLNAVTGTTSVSVNLSGLLANTLYDWRVRTNCSTGSGNFTPAQFSTIACDAPAGLISSAITSSSALLNWDAVSGALSYDVDYKSAFSGTWINAVTGVASTAVNLSSLAPGTLYDWRVRTTCIGGNAVYTQAQFTTLVCDMPVGLQSSAITTSSFTVSWNMVAGSLSYDVDYKTSASATWINAATAITGTSVNLSGLPPGTFYDWRVKANCSGGNSVYAVARFTTTCIIVTGLTAAPVTSSSEMLSWTNPSGYPLYYQAEYRPVSFPFFTSIGNSSLSTSVTLTGLQPSTTYLWRVKTFCSNGSFTYSAQDQFTTAANCNVPGGLTASAVTGVSAMVNWDAVPGALSYDIDYKPSTSNTWTNAATANTTTSINLLGLSVSALYDWRVRTNCSDGSGVYVQAQFTTLCPAPDGLNAVVNNSTSATISWTGISSMNYDVDYKPSASATWTNAATATPSTTVTLTGLTPSDSYDWRVRTNCTGGSSNYVQAQFFTFTGCDAAYEPNNTKGTAKRIQTGTNYFAAINSSTDIDYFWGQTTRAGQAVFSLTTPAAIDYEMNVYNINNVLVGSVSGVSAVKTITLNNSAYAAYYYIRIMGVNGSSNPNCYLLRMEETGNSNCPGVYDNSTNNAMSGAAQITINTDVYGRVYTPGDDDYYKIDLTNGDATTITLSDLPADYDLLLYNSAGTQLAASSTRGYGDEALSGNFAQGTYYILVKGYNGANNPFHCYKLRVQQGAAAKGQEVELISATTDEKTRSKINVFPNPVKNTLHLAIPNIKGMAMIRVFDMYGKMVWQKSTAQANTAIDISRLSAGMYMIRVMNDGREEVVKIVKE